MLTLSEMTTIVNGMEKDFAEVRVQAERRYDLYRMQKDPYVPEEIAREGKVRMPSSMLMYSAETMRADILMNPTEFTVIPLAREKDGSITKTNEQLAGNTERSLATLWGQLNEGRQIDREVIWHQLVSPFAVIMLEFNAYSPPDQPEGMADTAYNKLVDNYDSSWLPWRLHMPDPMSCFWVEREGKPIIFARHYKMLVTDIEDMYDHQPYAAEPDKKLIFEEERWKWVSDDYFRTTSRWALGFREVDVMWLDDGINIYQAVMGHQGADSASVDDNGQILSCVPNPTGRVTGFVVPGNTTPARLPHLRYEPYLLPLMQAISNINDLRAMRATAARNLAGPHTYIPIDAEIQKIYAARGEKLPTEFRWKKNVTPYLLGDVKEVPSELSDDWDKIEQQILAEEQRLLPAPYSNALDPEVLKSATATSILHAAEMSSRQYGPIMASYDAVIRDIMDSILISLQTTYADESVVLHSNGTEVARGKNLTEGAVFKLDAKTTDFPFKLLVVTRSMSQAQAAAQYQNVLSQYILPDGTKGPATLEDLIEAANYTDVVAQKMKIAQGEIVKELKPWLQQMAIAAAKKGIEDDSGITLPIGPQGMPTDASGVGGGGANAPAPSGMPNQAQRMDAPMVPGPSGGSSPLPPTGPV